MYNYKHIRSYLENKTIWVSIDETTDCYVSDVITGILEIGYVGKMFY